MVLSPRDLKVIYQEEKAGTHHCQRHLLRLSERTINLMYERALQRWAQPRRAMDIRYLDVGAQLVPHQWKHHREGLLEIFQMLFRGHQAL